MNTPGSSSTTENCGSSFLGRSETPGLICFFVTRSNASVLRLTFAFTDYALGRAPVTTTLPNFVLTPRGVVEPFVTLVEALLLFMFQSALFSYPTSYALRPPPRVAAAYPILSGHLPI